MFKMSFFVVMNAYDVGKVWSFFFQKIEEWSVEIVKKKKIEKYMCTYV
jgi:hypothetical protein